MKMEDQKSYNMETTGKSKKQTALKILKVTGQIAVVVGTPILTALGYKLGEKMFKSK